MKVTRINLIFGGITLAFSLIIQAAFAAEPSQPPASGKKAGQSEPTAADMKNSKERGLIFNTVNVGVGAGAAPPAAPKVPVIPKVAPAVKPAQAAHKTTHAPTTKSATAAPGKVSKPGRASATTQPATTVTHSTTAGDVMTVSQQVPAAAQTAVIKAWLDKPGNSPVYKVGEKMTVNIAAATDCNLVVFDYDGKSSLKQIFPNQYQPNGLVKAGDTVSIGGADSPFDYEVAGKGGVEQIFVYAYPTSVTQSPLTVAVAPVENSPFRAAELTIEQYRDLVNKSKVFFAREVKVVAKPGFKPVSAPSTATPNKIELGFQVAP